MGSGWEIRVDVSKELKFLGKFKKKKLGGGVGKGGCQVGEGWWGGGGGSGWM